MTLDANASKPLTEDVTQAVKHDLQNNTHLATRESFLDNFFPDDDENIGKVFRKFKNEGLYLEASQCWKSFPKREGRAEVKYYEAIQNILQRIQDLYCSETGDKVNRVWVDIHSKPPESFTNTAANRPDLVHAIGSKEEWDNRKTKLAGSDDGVQTRLRKEMKDAIDENKVSQKFITEFRKNFRVHWFRTSTVVEVKPNCFSWGSQEALDTVQQLAGYMRQILREQLDRRFVFGLIFFHNCLSIWYCDRSGLLGMDKVINIHEEPELFIRVIARLSTKSYTDLGWDPTMRFYQPGERKYSYELDFSKPEVVEYFRKSDRQYSTRWVITIKGKDYTTIRALSLSRAEIMCGRGQLVWLAVGVQDSKVVVIKQAWSPFYALDPSSTSPSQLRSEADFYRHVLSDESEQDTIKIGRLLADETVEGFRTGADFRRGIEYSESVPQRSSSNKRREAGADHTKLDRPQEEQLHERLTSTLIETFGNDTLKLTERQLCRMVFKDFGWPIKRFSSLDELLDVLRDCLEGYQFLLGKGVVHRDISPSNMLICPTIPLNPNECATVGRLNDLDHAKLDAYYNAVKMKDRDTKGKDPRENVSTTLELEDLPECDRDLFQFLWNLYGKPTYVVQYLRAIFDSFPENLSTFNADTCHLPIDQMNSIPPMFNDRLQQNEERSGTLPYMSHRLLISRPDQSPHTAINDMESIFWVLLYLCLTREGPGGGVRPELLDTSAPLTEDEEKFRVKLGHLVYCFFDAVEPSVLAENKGILFNTPGDFREYITGSIHPYFQPLVSLLEEWFRILCVAYDKHLDDKCPEYIWPHLMFQHALGRFRESEAFLASKAKLDDDPQYREMTEDENLRRMSYIHDILEMCDQVREGSDGKALGEIPVPELDPSPRTRQSGSAGETYSQVGSHRNDASVASTLADPRGNKKARRR